MIVDNKENTKTKMPFRHNDFLPQRQEGELL